MTSNTYVSKVKVNEKTVYLKLQWRQNERELFHLQIITDIGTGWSGTFDNHIAQKYIDKLYQTKDFYYANAKKCLTGEGGDDYLIHLCESDDGNTATFYWKKRSAEFLQEQGSLILNRDDSTELKDTLVDFLIDENNKLRSTISNMDQQMNVMKTEIGTCKKDLEKFVDIKSSVESNLYGKFVQLLNTKKQRIQSLEEELRKYV